MNYNICLKSQRSGKRSNEENLKHKINIKMVMVTAYGNGTQFYKMRTVEVEWKGSI